jgi:hypothetical protein
MEHGAHGVITIDGGDTDHCLGDPRHKPPSFCVDWQICLPGYHHSSGGVIGALGELEPCRQVPRVLSWGDRIDIPPLSRRHAETRITPWLRHGGVPIGRLGFRQRERERDSAEREVESFESRPESQIVLPWALAFQSNNQPFTRNFPKQKSLFTRAGVPGQYSPNLQTAESTRAIQPKPTNGKKWFFFLFFFFFF